MRRKPALIAIIIAFGVAQGLSGASANALDVCNRLLFGGPAVESYSGSQAVASAPAVDVAKVDAVFGRWTTSTAGCAVGVGIGGRSVLEKAYGMADLEHDVANKADTIF